MERVYSPGPFDIVARENSFGVVAMASLLIKNIGTLVTGDLKNPRRAADTIFIDGGIIREIGYCG